MAVHTNRKSVDEHRDILLLNGACKPNTRAVQSPASQTHVLTSHRGISGLWGSPHSAGNPVSSSAGSGGMAEGFGSQSTSGGMTDRIRLHNLQNQSWLGNLSRFALVEWFSNEPVQSWHPGTEREAGAGARGTGRLWL